jgi:hypothetical protein
MGQHYCLHCEYVSVLSYFVLMCSFVLRWQNLFRLKVSWMLSVEAKNFCRGKSWQNLVLN